MQKLNQIKDNILAYSTFYYRIFYEKCIPSILIELKTICFFNAYNQQWYFKICIYINDYSRMRLNCCLRYSTDSYYINLTWRKYILKMNTAKFIYFEAFETSLAVSLTCLMISANVLVGLSIEVRPIVRFWEK